MKRKVLTRRLSGDGKVVQIIFPGERRKRSAPIVLKPRTLELFAIRISSVRLIIGTKIALSHLFDTFPRSWQFPISVPNLSRIFGPSVIQILEVGSTFEVHDFQKIHQLVPSIGLE